jgi:integrase
MTEIRPGVWRLRVYESPGKYRQPIFHGTRAEALDARYDVAHQIAESPRRVEGTVHDLMERWLAWRSPHLSPATVRGYRLVLDRYIVPHLGDVQMANVTGRMIDEFYVELGRSGSVGNPISASTIRKVHANLRTAFAQAVKWEMIAANPVLAATPPPVREQELAPPSGKTVAVAMAAAKSRVALITFLRLAAITGARRGELVALRVDDLDLDNRILTISRAATLDPDGEVVLKSTKTNRVRSLSLDRKTVTQVRWLMRSQARAGVTMVDNPFLFSADPTHSVPWKPDAASRAWVRLRSQIPGMERVRLHDLRHFMVTQMLAAGVDVRTVAGRAGHANPSMTLNRYGHFMPAKDRAAADDLGGMFDDPPDAA